MGLPTGVALDPTNTPVNALPFRAYNLIYNEWFRDENLIDSIPVLTGDGPDPISNYTLRKRAKRHDYFTSALPWPQKGPSVDVGLTGNAPIVGFGQDGYQFNFTSDVADGQGPSSGWQLGTADVNDLGKLQAFLETQLVLVIKLELGKITAHPALLGQMLFNKKMKVLLFS